MYISYYIHYIHVDNVQFNASHHTERTACMCETRTCIRKSVKQLDPCAYMYGSLTEQTLCEPCVHVQYNRRSNMEFNISKNHIS